MSSNFSPDQASEHAEFSCCWQASGEHVLLTWLDGFEVMLPDKLATCCCLTAWSIACACQSTEDNMLPCVDICFAEHIQISFIKYKIHLFQHVHLAWIDHADSEQTKQTDSHALLWGKSAHCIMMTGHQQLPSSSFAVLCRQCCGVEEGCWPDFQLR